VINVSCEGSSERKREPSEFQSRKGILGEKGKLQALARMVQQLSQLSHEVVVVFVRANPEPDDEIAVTTRESAIMITDSN
jgi:hypothetical protein